MEPKQKLTQRKGNSMMGALGVDWKEQNEIYFLQHEKDFTFTTHAQVCALRAYYKHDVRVEKLYYLKEKNEEIENTARVSAAGVGLLGVAAVCESLFGEEKNRKKRHWTGVLGGLTAAAGVVGGLTSQCYAFHGFLVLQCSEGVWVSMEKNNESISVQVGNSHHDVISYKNGSSTSSGSFCGGYDQNIENKRGETTELRHMALKSSRHRRHVPGLVAEEEEILRLEDILIWIVETDQTHKGYNIITRNCKNFAKELWEYASRFSSNPQPFPHYEDEVTQMITGGVKALNTI